MACSARLLTVHSPVDADRQLAALHIDPFTRRNIGPKMLYRLVRVEGIDNSQARILKEEMVALGGDAAIGRDAESESSHPVVLLMGTEKQLHRFCGTLSRHPLGFAALAGELLRLLKIEASPPNLWNIGSKVCDFSERLCVMGILNVTPDSFSDGNCFLDADRAAERALQMETEGADIIDIGGESTRPFAPPVSENEELRRIMPVLERLKGKLSIPISIDTYKSGVAREALAAGAEIINDISGLAFDPRMAETVAEAEAGLVLMHTSGRPAEMQKHTLYESIIDDVTRYLRDALALAEAAGIPAERTVIDPGIGFGKSVEGNIEILGRLREFSTLGRPLLIGTSRKGFIGTILGREKGKRLMGTAATVALAVAQGASIFRVHDVREMRDVVDMAFAIKARQTG